MPGSTPDGVGTGKSRKGAWILAAIIGILAAVGAFFAVRALLGGDDVTGGIDECRIAADGSLTASGWVDSDQRETRIEVRFDDAETGVEADRAETSLDTSGGDRVPFTLEGQAGDEVNRVTCVLAPLE